jgi:hypothetical protein
MRRRVVALVWIAGAAVPLLMATAFLVGCCVLPFHGVIHKLMPFCEMAAHVMRGESAADGHGHDAMPPAPSREKQEPVKRIATEVPDAYRFVVSSGTAHAVAATATTAYRSFITLGAIRCDRDVGLHVLVDTFRI